MQYLSLSLLLLSPLCMVMICTAGILDFSGQASAWLAVAEVDSLQAECGIRYIPSLVASIPFGGTHLIDAEVSFNGNAVIEQIRSINDYGTDYSLDPYRLWLRVSGTQYELRGGLQKIDFGSATVFRPLMWFDQIDVRDPLRITDGVYAMLFRYYFLNNTNIWIWGLYGNDEVKGWEAYPTDSGKIEYGGRVQIPLLTGECAMTYHHRELSLGNLHPDAVGENRFGVDGKWDIGVGVWVEGTIVHQDLSILPEFLRQQFPILQFEYQRYLNAGIDYTFGIGNGIYMLTEHFVTDLATGVAATAKDRTQFSALMLRYSLGTVDELSAAMYYDWENERFYRYAKWARSYDRWVINLVGFWNPEMPIYGNGNASSALAGTGGQLIIVFNH